MTVALSYIHWDSEFGRDTIETYRSRKTVKKQWHTFKARILYVYLLLIIGDCNVTYIYDQL